MDPSKDTNNGLIIGISGNIGAGKTTIGKLLAEHLNAEFYQEPVNDLLLQQFLANPDKYAYAFQLYMLTRRQLNYALAEENKKYGKITVIDRTLRCDKVFACQQHTNNSITDDELRIYKSVYDDFMPYKPDVVIHLDASIDTLMQRIQKRDRAGETVYTREYLTNLTNEYNIALNELEENNIRICRLDWNADIDLTSETAVQALLEEITQKVIST